ncbi:hypothetical protein MUP77_00840 [Candidatus Bathyarchaeota archaeon]|nr:hypothetical protein [Candidatus Bathyarchaeota archaeon]
MNGIKNWAVARAEESLFTIHELIQVVKERDKTRTYIPAERFVGIISTWRRFERKEGY